MNDVSHVLGNTQLGDQEDDDSGGVLGALLEFPAVLVAHVLSKLSCVDHFALARVNRACRDKVYQLEPVAWLQNVEDSIRFVGSRRIRREDEAFMAIRVDVLKFLCRDGSHRCLKARENFGFPHTRACKVAAERGDLEMLKYLREEHHCPWNEEVCRAAAEGGHLEVLKWLRANGCPWTHKTCEAAVTAGHREVFHWARENGCPNLRV